MEFAPCWLLQRGQGQEYKLAKASLFGFRDCDGHNYQFAPGNRHYPILNPGEKLLIYKVEQPTVSKSLGYVHLFFSPTATAPIQPRTLLNLKRLIPPTIASMICWTPSSSRAATWPLTTTLTA